jgi:hypothetical protein
MKQIIDKSLHGIILAGKSGLANRNQSQTRKVIQFKSFSDNI